jgi:hypothetical protein
MAQTDLICIRKPKVWRQIAVAGETRKTLDTDNRLVIEAYNWLKDDLRITKLKR